MEWIVPKKARVGIPIDVSVKALFERSPVCVNLPGCKLPGTDNHHLLAIVN
jgi:hypothetical protein